MAVDIVPELYEKIEKSFNEKVNKSRKIKKFEAKLKAGKASESDVSIYASNLGDIAAEVFTEVLTEDALPDGRMYWNIANRTIKPIHELIYKMVNDAAFIQQREENEQDGFNIKPKRPDFPKQKIDDLMWKFASIFDEVTNE